MATLTRPSERHLAIDELDKSIVNLSARINASTYELLVLIREFDERAGWLK
jgi:TPP-dependent pyruvate/acetoin dehydrogenase alpha subunit